MSNSSPASRLRSVMHKVGKAGSAFNLNVTGGGQQSPSPPPHAGIVHGQVLNCYKAVRDYVTRMANSVKGMKAMLLDPHTTGFVGLVYSQSELIKQEVFLVESIHVLADGMLEETAEEAAMRAQLRKGAIMKTENVGINNQSMQHLKAVVFVQPNSTTLEKLGVLLKSPRYSEYHIFFSNIVPSGYLEALADLDIYSRIQEVHEYYGDYLSVQPSLFHFDSNSHQANEEIQKNKAFSSVASWMYDRDFQGLISVLLSLKRRPDIRYMASSELCKKLSYDLAHTMREEQELFTFGSSDPTLLLVLDRREDVVTPLLTQWTYQAMVHELLGIDKNRVTLPEPINKSSKKDAASSTDKSQEDRDALHEVVLSPEQDSFFKSTMLVNFGELGVRVKKLVSDFQSLTHTHTKLDTLEDMQRFVDAYPQFKLQSGTVSKHVSLMGEISRLVNARKLLTVSAIEQEIVCGSEHQEVADKVAALMDDPAIQFLDKFRVVLLYALRYESHPTNHLGTFRNLLRAHARMANYSERVLEMIDTLLLWSHDSSPAASSRSWPLFPHHAPLSLKTMVKSISTNVKGVDNIYTQHSPILQDILTTLMDGELKTQQFPFADSGNTRTIYRRIIVFMVGGVTYEESAAVEALLQTPKYRGNFTVLLGGSCIHNSTSFLREVGPMEQYKLTTEQMRAATEDGQRAPTRQPGMPPPGMAGPPRAPQPRYQSPYTPLPPQQQPGYPSSTPYRAPPSNSSLATPSDVRLQMESPTIGPPRLPPSQPRAQAQRQAAPGQRPPLRQQQPPAGVPRRLPPPSSY